MRASRIACVQRTHREPQSMLQGVIKKPTGHQLKKAWPPLGPVRLGMDICMRDSVTGTRHNPTIYGSSSVLQLKPSHGYDILVRPKPNDRITTNVLYDSLRVVCFTNLGGNAMICIPATSAEHVLLSMTTLPHGPLSMTIIVWPCLGKETLNRSSDVTFRIFLQAEMGAAQLRCPETIEYRDVEDPLVFPTPTHRLVVINPAPRDKPKQQEILEKRVVIAKKE